MPSTSCWLRSRRALSKKDRSREPTEDFPAGIAGRNGEGDDRRLAIGRQDAAFVAARCNALDRQRRSQLAGMARYRRRADCAARATGEARERSADARLSARTSAGHGRIQSLSGSPAHDFRPGHSLPYLARTRFDGSRPGESVRAPDRYPEDTVYRLQQIGQHARAQHLQTIFLRTHEANGGRDESRQPVRRDHRSGIEDAAGCGG